MAVIVTGIFNGVQQAQQAVENLISSGFVADCIDISVNNSLYENHGNNPASGNKSKNWTADESNPDSVSDNFCNNPKDATYKYASVAGRASVVTVCTDIDGLVKLAAGILDHSGAVDIEKKSAEYGFGGQIVFNAYRAGIA